MECQAQRQRATSRRPGALSDRAGPRIHGPTAFPTDTALTCVSIQHHTPLKSVSGGCVPALSTRGSWWVQSFINHFLFFCGHFVWHVGSYFPRQESNLCPLHWESRVLPTGLPFINHFPCVSSDLSVPLYTRLRVFPAEMHRPPLRKSRHISWVSGVTLGPRPHRGETLLLRTQKQGFIFPPCPGRGERRLPAYYALYGG